ncbi:MAG: hypothetical protein ACFFCM_21415 [Promethearchaeota archaeon]
MPIKDKPIESIEFEKKIGEIKKNPKDFEFFINNLAAYFIIMLKREDKVEKKDGSKELINIQYIEIEPREPNSLSFIRKPDHISRTTFKISFIKKGKKFEIFYYGKVEKINDLKKKKFKKWAPKWIESHLPREIKIVIKKTLDYTKIGYILNVKPIESIEIEKKIGEIIKIPKDFELFINNLAAEFINTMKKVNKIKKNDGSMELIYVQCIEIKPREPNSLSFIMKPDHIVRTTFKISFIKKGKKFEIFYYGKIENINDVWRKKFKDWAPKFIGKYNLWGIEHLIIMALDYTEQGFVLEPEVIKTTYNCPKCNGPISKENTELLLKGELISCEYCDVTIQFGMGF